jgi:hypothetical protein
MATDLATANDLVTDLDVSRGDASPVDRLQMRLTTILDTMARVLVPHRDYGIIPGTQKFSLLKPGAEKLCLVFGLAAGDPTIDEPMSDDCDVVRFRVRVPITTASGRVVAVGVGEASTDEEKYKWRRPVCDEEYADTPDTLRRQKWQRRAGGSPEKIKQIREVPADKSNTVLKMAHKRAFIHGTLLATGASSIFNQEPEKLRGELKSVKDQPIPQPPGRKSARAPEPPAPAAATSPAANITADSIPFEG